jgi:hypothetical protein
MEKERIAAMADRIAQKEAPKEGGNDEALANVDQAIDTMVAAVTILLENLPKVKTDNVPEKAAIDTVQGLVDEAIAPYLGDIVKAMHNAFGE